MRLANLGLADLSGANLIGANLRGVNLIGADLSNTLLDENQVAYLEKVYDLFGVKVQLHNTNHTESYREYCDRRKQ